MIPIDQLTKLLDRSRQSIAKTIIKLNIPTELIKTPYNRNTIAIAEEHLPTLIEFFANTRTYQKHAKRKQKFSAAVITEYRDVMPVRMMI